MLPDDSEMYPPPPETVVVSELQFVLNVAFTDRSPFMVTKVDLVESSSVPAHVSQA